MKTFRAKTGPFAHQPYYETAEVEAICTDELRRHNLYPSTPSPVRIDRFVEKRFAVSPTYEDLPKGVLGFTKFGPRGVEDIVVSSAFDEAGTKPAERRLRTTLAHEAGHGLLHAHLFVLGEQPRMLFGDGLASDVPKILCRDDGQVAAADTAKKPPYRWWEFQANQAMSALLLPKVLFEEALMPFLERGGLLGMPTLPDGHRDGAVRSLAETFDVNPVVVKIRLATLFPTASGAQLTL